MAVYTYQNLTLVDLATGGKSCDCERTLRVQNDVVIANLDDGLMLWLLFEKSPTLVNVDSRPIGFTVLDLRWTGRYLPVCHWDGIEAWSPIVPASARR
jgi:hypothetical protein